jgi:hypothetical protein
LLDVTNNPSSNGYLFYNGVSWETNSAINTVNFQVNGDSGPNLIVDNGDTWILDGDNYIDVVNFNPITTRFQLNVANVANDINLEDLGNVFGSPSTNDTVVYDGTQWVFQQNVSAGSGWLLGGNTVSSTQTFGTLSNHALPIVTNGIERLRVMQNGFVGVNTTSPSNHLDVRGSVGCGDIKTVTTNYTLTDSDYMVLVDASISAVVITVPPAISALRRDYVVKKIDSSNNVVQLTTVLPSTIDGATTRIISSQYNAVKIKSNGSAWWIY